MAKLSYILLCLGFLLQGANSFSSPVRRSLKRPQSATTSSLFNAASSAVPAPEDSLTTEQVAPSTDTAPKLSKKERLWQQAKKEGGLFTFKTKYGALNPYAIYYGVTSIFLGLFWYVALTGLQFFYFITRGRFDKRRSMVNFANQVWGETLMTAVRARPEFVNKEKLTKFFKREQAAMFVANHNSWLDIPFVGGTIGWRNYKLVSKAELGKVPILGKAIQLGRHIMVDRSDRRSQIATLRNGMDLLKNGIHLCTFPEGTRAKSGHMLPFKNGAFKMAHKVGAPIIPLSIVGSGRAMPFYWMFPFRAARSMGAQVIIHDPIESTDKTEAELAEAVRQAIIDGLPEDQKPLEKKEDKSDDKA